MPFTMKLTVSSRFAGSVERKTRPWPPQRRGSRKPFCGGVTVPGDQQGQIDENAARSAEFSCTTFFVNDLTHRHRRRFNDRFGAFHGDDDA